MMMEMEITEEEGAHVTKNLLMLCDFGLSLINIRQLAISGNLLIPMTPPKWVWCATGTAFQQLYLHLSNLLPVYHRLP
jgi:hypothetical protein